MHAHSGGEGFAEGRTDAVGAFALDMTCVVCFVGAGAIAEVAGAIAGRRAGYIIAASIISLRAAEESSSQSRSNAAFSFALKSGGHSMPYAAFCARSTW